MINSRIASLRLEMKKELIDAYIILSGDFHQSEYAGDYFCVREYVSGFTGSSGTLLVTQNECILWTDGRYFIQAETQLKGTDIKLYKTGEPDVPDIINFLKCYIKSDNFVIGFDGRVVSASFCNQLLTRLNNLNPIIKYDIDLADRIWYSRPALPASPAFFLDISYTGKSCSDKLRDIRKIMAENNSDYHLIASLDDIAWLLNMRGNDIKHNPVVLCYLALTPQEAVLFINPSSINEEIHKFLLSQGIRLEAYNDIFKYASKIHDGKKVMLDPERINYMLLKSLKNNVNIIKLTNPSSEYKAIKNKDEIENIKKVHIKDGVAVTRFLYWLNKNIGKIKITELSASNMLEFFRQEQEDYVELSFDTIAGYNEHGAIIHYEPTKETDIELLPIGLLLLDSGAQYYGGTTDITRTITLGPITDDMRTHYTAVLRANLNLAAAFFHEGCCGANLDILAREPLWEKELDYNHGTGHGVGCFLNVHEGPQSLNWKILPGRSCTVELKDGMILTDEPGIYIEGSYGIRIENMLLCTKCSDNSPFLHFEILTLAPIGLEAVNIDELTKKEKDTLNTYHANVYDKLSPFLNVNERKWLKSVTSPV